MWAEWPMTEVKLLSGCVCIDVCLCVGPDLGLESLINLSVRVRKVNDIPCSSKTCVCTWFFSSSPPPTAVFALSKQANERLLFYKCCRFKTSSALRTVTSVAWCQIPHKKDIVFFSQANTVVTVIDLQCVLSKPMHLNKEFKWTL